MGRQTDALEREQRVQEVAERLLPACLEVHLCSDKPDYGDILPGAFQLAEEFVAMCEKRRMKVIKANPMPDAVGSER